MVSQDATFEKINKTYMKKLFILLFVGLFLMSSCSKDPVSSQPNPINALDTITTFSGILIPTENKLVVNFEHYFKNNPIVYATQNYITDNQDTIQVNNLSYRVSNMQLYNSLVQKWVDVGTYKLNSGDDAFKYGFTINKVPAGLYNKIRFNLGVDSARNRSGEQTGDLDPSLGMYWNWTNGYIHYRLEGRILPSLITFSLDIGGSTNVVNKEIDLTNYKIKSLTNGISINYKIDVNSFLSSPNLYNLQTDPKDIHTETVPVIKTKLLPNMLNMISLTSVSAN